MDWAYCFLKLVYVVIFWNEGTRMKKRKRRITCISALGFGYPGSLNETKKIDVGNIWIRSVARSIHYWAGLG